MGPEGVGWGSEGEWVGQERPVLAHQFGAHADSTHALAVSRALYTTGASPSRQKREGREGRGEGGEGGGWTVHNAAMSCMQL